MASSDSDQDQDQDPGTDDSGVDSINSDPQLNISPAQCSDSGLEMASRLRAETESGVSVRSFLHGSKHSELWSGALSPQDDLNTSGDQMMVIITSQYLNISCLAPSSP